MKNPRIYTAAKISYCNRFITLDSEIVEVEAPDPGEIEYKDGMVSFKFLEIIEYEKQGQIYQKTYNQSDEEYFFGTFKSIEDLKIENKKSGEWETAIGNIEGLKGIGMVISPDGFKSCFPANGILLDPYEIRKTR